ncbi:MAG: DEAD/DEAH box helicase family protein [Armatimonas sp.]
MARRSRSTLVRTFRNEDLVLSVGSGNAAQYQEDRYEGFFDSLCGSREYQKEAIRAAVRYLLGGKYQSLTELAQENFRRNPMLAERYTTWDQMRSKLQLPDQLSASLDLSTGTGKSYVLYGIAAILLAEGAVDNVLVLCPSTTIEEGLTAKFKDLAADAQLRNTLPLNARIATPDVINASESIVTGSLCVENYHAVLNHVGSSVRESLWGKGARTLILNDEVHHVATEVGESKKWKDFLADPAYGFRFLIGVSGTCYVGDDYFADVIYRYSLRQAMEEKYVKIVNYVSEMPKTSGNDEKWQLIRNNHEQNKQALAAQSILPLTIIVTPTVSRCKDVTEYLSHFLQEKDQLTSDEVKRRVLCIYNNAPDVRRLSTVDKTSSQVEWIVAVSMLSEGWDVQRVFQIVPDEERAFNSKLLISQVLGRGLRIPISWQEPKQPEVTVFNHDAWTNKIEHLVNEVLEIENRLSVSVIPESPFHFTLHHLNYTREATSIKKAQEKPYRLFENGYVDLAAEAVEEIVSVEMAKATTGERFTTYNTLRHKTYTVREIAQVMWDRLDEACDPDDPDPARHYRYTNEWTISKLEGIVNESLRRRGMEVATERMRQKFLQALGTLNRGSSEYARYNTVPNSFFEVSTMTRQADSVSEGELKRDKTYYYTDETRQYLKSEQQLCFDAVTDEGSGYKHVSTAKACFKTPLTAAIADSGPEAQFYKQLRASINQEHITSWLKNTAIGFYQIDYYWKKGAHPKSGKFSPDFFIKTGDRILVIEVKGDEEIDEPSPENIKKNEYALAHFKRINEHLEGTDSPNRYQFHFVTPQSFNTLFQLLRERRIEDFSSDLDVKLREEA